MSSTLFWTEIIGLFLAVPLLMLSVELINTEQSHPLQTENNGIAQWQILMLITISLIIISFATWSATGRLNPIN